MSRPRPWFTLLVSLSAVAWPVLRAGTPPAPADDGAYQFLSAADPRFRYDGRIDFTDPTAPVIIWQGTRISLDFAGDTLALCFGDATGQNFFDVRVDGAAAVMAVPAGAGGLLQYPGALAPGRHHLELFKRSEAAAGHVRFRGIEIARGAEVWASAPPQYRLAMEFIGDSITVGACNEDGPEDQWADRRTHDNARSYAALAADALSADYRNLAVSGMGIAAGWVTVKAGQIWDRLYPEAGAARADLRAWTPDVVLINLGENDDSYTRAHNLPFPAGYTAGYVALVEAVRRAYPRAEIVLLRGGMYGGARSVPLREAWEAAVRQLEAADPAVHHFVFTHWTKNHPRVADDRAMANELVGWLRAQPFIQRRF